MLQAVVGTFTIFAVHTYDLIRLPSDVQHNCYEVVVAPSVGVDADDVAAVDRAALAPMAPGRAGYEVVGVDLRVGGAELQLVLGVPCRGGHAAGFAGAARPVGVSPVYRVQRVVDRYAVPVASVRVPELAKPVELGVGG